MYEAPPSPNYDKDIDRLVRYYKRAYKEILGLLVEMRNTPESENIYLRQASVLRQIEVILSQLNQNNRAWCTEMVRQAFLDGQASAILTTGGALTLAEAMGQAKFSMISQPVVDSLINDTFSDLLKATNNTSKQVKQLVQQTVADVMRLRTANNFGRNTIRNDIVKQLTNKAIAMKLEKDGFIGIIDKAGRPWSTQRYADMISRTKLNQAHVEGVKQEGKKRGLDLAVISTHMAEDECRQFEGMIISLSGQTEGLLSYQQLYDTNKIWHPNCQHKVHLIKLELLPKAVLDKHNSKVANLSDKGLQGQIRPLESIKIPDKETIKQSV